MADKNTSIIISAIDQTKAGLDQVRNNLSGIQTAAKAVGISLSAMGMVALVEQSIDAADKLGDLSKVTRLTVEQLAGLDLAAQQSGLDLSGVADAVSKLSENIGKNADKFAKIGVTAKDPIEAFKQLADVSNAIADPQQRAAFLAEALGKSWKAAAPLLSEGSGRIGEMVDQGTLLAGNIGQMQERSDAFNDSFAVLNATMKGKISNTVNDMLPLLQLMATGLTDTGEGARALDIGFNPVTETLRAVAVLAGNVGFVLNGVGTEIGGIAAQLVAFGSGDFKGALAIGDAMKADAAKSRSAFDEWEASMMSAGKTATTETAKVASVVGVNTGAVRNFIGEQKNVVSEYDKLIAKLNGGLVSATAAAQAALHGFNKEQGKALELFASPEWAKMSEKQRIKAAAIMEATIAQAMEADALEKTKKATEEALKSQQEYMAGIGKEAESLLEKAAAAEEENARIGLTAVQLAGLTVRRYDEQIALKMAAATTLKAMGGREAEVFLIEQQIEALQRLAGAAAAKPALEASAEAVKKQGDDWKNFARDIEGSLTDALMNGFKNGENFGETFFSTLEAAAKTTILKFGVQLITGPIMGGIQSVAQGGSFIMQGASGLANIGSAFTTGGALTSAAGGYGTFAASGVGQAIGLSEMAVIPGSGGMAAGSTLTGLGTAMPYIAAAVLAYSLLKGNGGTPTASTGHAVIDYNAAGAQAGYQSQYGVQNAGTDSFVAGMEASYMQYAKALGIGTVGTQFGYATNTGEDGQHPNFGLSGGGFVQAETAYSEAAVSEAASRAVFAALQSSELPVYLAGLFDPEKYNAATMSQQDISNTLAFAGTLKQVRDGLTETRTPFKILEDNLKTGAAELRTTAATFKTDFVAAIDAGISPETFAEWSALGAVIDQVTQATAAARVAIDDYLGADLMGDYAKSTATLHEQWMSGTETIRGLTSSYDGSIAAQQTLGAAIQTQYQTELQLIGQIQAALSDTQGMFSATAENFMLDTMTDQQRYDYYGQDAAAQMLLLATATDPTVIASIAARIDRDHNAAWNLLTPEQKLGAQPGFLSLNSAASDLSIGRLNLANESVVAGHAAIATSITTAMDPLIIEIRAMYAEMKAAAQKIDGAGDKINQAADKPAVADIHVSVSAPEGYEVYVG